jgi:hypothetical protein
LERPQETPNPVTIKTPRQQDSFFVIQCSRRFYKDLQDHNPKPESTQQGDRMLKYTKKTPNSFQKSVFLTVRSHNGLSGIRSSVAGGLRGGHRKKRETVHPSSAVWIVTDSDEGDRSW